jgi:nitroreductase
MAAATQRLSPLRVARGVKRRSQARFDRAMDRVSLPLARSRRLSGLYYGLSTRIFGREHQAVLAGKRRYLEIHADGRQRYLLRRNIHMLEKGLSMRPRREVFAVDYIGPTVDVYTSLVGGDESRCTADLELQWANDVLAAYFEIAGDHPVIEGAKRKFRQAPLGMDARAGRPGLSPYTRDLTAPPPVEYDDLLRLAERRRSVRWFDDRPVPREMIEQAMTVAGYAPSACNRQPFEFRVFDDPETVREVAAIPMGTRGWVDQIPVFVVIVGTLSAFFSERDRHLIYTDGCLAAMGFLLALESLGLSSCCVNWPDIAEREQKMAKVLGLRPDERPVMCIALGWPDPEGFVPYSQKKPSTELLRFNFE